MEELGDTLAARMARIHIRAAYAHIVGLEARQKEAADRIEQLEAQLTEAAAERIRVKADVSRMAAEIRNASVRLANTVFTPEDLQRALKE